MTGPLRSYAPLEDLRLPGVDIKNPIVTVVVTSYNYERYIGQCLHSVARQTYPHMNCVVVDDCSTDDSRAMIEAFVASKAAGGRFKFIARERNGGQMAAFKTGIGAAESPFIVLVDSDDVLLEDFIAAHLATHLSCHTVAFTSSNQFQIDNNSELIGGNHHDLQCQGSYRHVYQTALQHPFWLWATTSSMMFRKSILELVLPDEEEPFRICADNYLVHFCNLLGGSLLIPTVHGAYRRHGLNGFGANPVIGGHLPVGDMSKHPKHEVVRSAILNHLLRRREQIEPLFGPNEFLSIVMRVALPEDYVRIVYEYPQIFPKSPGHYRRKHRIYHYKRRWWKWKGKHLNKKK